MSALCRCGCGELAPIAPYSVSTTGWVKGLPRPYIKGHNRKIPGPEVEMVDLGFKTLCWRWRGNLDRDGYPLVKRGGEYRAHRWYYTHYVGPIPEGYQVDHLCRVKSCVKPDHLEPVTHQENQRRAAAARTHCKRGHEYTPENILIDGGRRRCRSCRYLKPEKAAA